MQGDLVQTLEYARPPSTPRRQSKLIWVIIGFFGGWSLGVIITGVFADIIIPWITGYYHDGGMCVISAVGIVIEAPAIAFARVVFGQRINGLIAFIFGLVCGPLIFSVLMLIG